MTGRDDDELSELPGIAALFDALTAPASFAEHSGEGCARAMFRAEFGARRRRRRRAAVAVGAVSIVLTSGTAAAVTGVLPGPVRVLGRAIVQTAQRPAAHPAQQPQVHPRASIAPTTTAPTPGHATTPAPGGRHVAPTVSAAGSCAATGVAPSAGAAPGPRTSATEHGAGPCASARGHLKKAEPTARRTSPPVTHPGGDGPVHATPAGPTGALRHPEPDAFSAPARRQPSIPGRGTEVRGGAYRSAGSE